MTDDPRLGLLAFGDSITNGGGELQWGIALQSWAQWTARALGLPFTNFAVDGARVADVARSQLAAARERSAHPDARYDLGALHLGVNDVRSVDWDPDAFAADLRIVLVYLAERCDRIVILTIPLDLGRPRTGAKVEVANAVIEEAAREVGATVVDLRGFRGRRVLMADHVHPTALGQIAIAERVIDAMSREGMPVFVPQLRQGDGDDPRTNLPAVREGGGQPRPLVTYETTTITRLRSDLTYAYRHAKVSARALRIRLLGR
ncbi:MAG TPA: GDSL-type esterase/lipase family protein [Solirubrobacterales bacterium]